MTAVRITWWGHATATLEIGGVRLLTDPALTAHLAHLSRLGSPVPPDAAGDADAVLISHLHADHLHLPSLRRVHAGQVIVPAGGGRVAARAGVGLVDEVEVGGVVDVGGVRVTAVPASHDGRRLPGSPVRGPALGYLIEHDRTRVWFAGDTGLFDAMPELGPVDVALIPVGGWGPTLGPHHLDPVQAAEALVRVRARHAVPIHFGTFWPTGLRPVAPGTFRRMFVEPGQRFADAVGSSGARVHLLDCGGVAEIDVPGDRGGDGG